MDLKVPPSKWAEKLIDYHRNPVLKLDLSGTKLFHPLKTEEENALVAKNIKAYVDILKTVRVERRCARTSGLFWRKGNIVKVNRIIGPLLLNFGVQNKDGVYLSREEALFLLETNRLELKWNSCDMSIQQAFSILISNTSDFFNYMMYKKLTLKGFKICKALSNKRKREETESTTNKKFTLVENEGHVTKENRNECHRKTDETNLNEDRDGANSPHYTIYVPTEPASELKLFCCGKYDAEDYLKYAQRDTVNIIALPFPDSVAFYSLAVVDLPVL